MEPRSKFDRLVFTHRLVEAGLTLVTEAQEFTKRDHARAKGIRNGLMIVLLGLFPMRIKNFAALDTGVSLKRESGSWWITVPRSTTKTGNIEERRVPERFNGVIELYLNECRPVLQKSGVINALWISSTTGRRLTAKNLGTLISKITLQTLGVDVSPHLFRTAAATTAAMFGGDTPHLATGVLVQRDPKVAQENYIRTTSINAAKAYARIVGEYRSP